MTNQEQASGTQLQPIISQRGIEPTRRRDCEFGRVVGWQRDIGLGDALGASSRHRSDTDRLPHRT